jgi:SAM-dependent methyltransferase
MEPSFEKYSDGKSLYGDDASPEQIAAWFRDEKEAYFKLGFGREQGHYGYHELNWRHGFSHLAANRFEHVLGIGSAFGDELEPVLDRSDKVTILEPSSGFQNARFDYVCPDPSGLMNFPDDTFDLITCFGVLHHIPNVTAVMCELAR